MSWLRSLADRVGKENTSSFLKFKHPNRARRLGPPRTPGAQARELFGSRFLGDGLGSQPKVRASRAQSFSSAATLCLSDCLQAFGLNEDEARELGRELKVKPSAVEELDDDFS